MTHLEVSIDHLVLHGVSPEVGREVGVLVRQRLASLASGADDVRRGPGSEFPSESARIADEVAQRLWARISVEREAVR